MMMINSREGYELDSSCIQFTAPTICAVFYIQGVSGGIVNILGDSSMDYSE